MTIRHKLLAAFGSLSLFVALLGCGVYFHVSEIVQDLSEIEASVEPAVRQDLQASQAYIGFLRNVFLGICVCGLIIVFLIGLFLSNYINITINRLLGLIKNLPERQGDEELRSLQKDEFGKIAAAVGGLGMQLREARLAVLEMEQLSQLSVELKQQNDALNNFVYRVSHDLRAPVINVESLISLLRKQIGSENKRSRETLEFIEKSTTKLQRIIHDLLEVSRIERKLLEASVVINLEGLMREVKGELGDLIESKSAVINEDFSVAAEINFPKSSLKTILINLISNGIRYHKEDQPPEILVQTQRSEDALVIVVQDNGLGIDLVRYGDKLFGLFNRFHDHVEGSGVGLYIVQKLVKENGGMIKVQSKIGRGSKFIIELPFTVALSDIQKTIETSS